MKDLAIHILFLVTFGLLPACGLPAVIGPKPSGTILFRDDFSNPSSGWDRRWDSSNVTDYQGGGYRILVGEAHGVLWSNPGQRFGDVRIEVDATKIAGPDDNNFGVICRYQDSKDFYFLLLSSDGYVGIGKVARGAETLISGERMVKSGAVRLGQAINHIRADCFASQFVLYANGSRVAAAQDSGLVQGDAGLMAGTYDTPGADILFRNFVVSSP